jgi:hypothetical protein
LYIESSNAGNIDSGVAIANLGSAPTPVFLSVWDATGVTRLGNTYSLPAGAQMAKFLHELFPTLPTPFKGILQIGASVGATNLSVTGLRTRVNERGDFLITTTPPWKVSTPLTASPLYFPQVVIGGGYTTQFILFTGSTNQTSAGLLHFLNSDGSVWPLRLN